FLHWSHDRHHLRPVADYGRRNRSGRHATGRGHYPGRTRPRASRRQHRIERRARHAVAARPRGRAMIVRSSGSQPVRLEQDVVLARQTVRKLTQECAMRLIDQTKLVTAVSELARNTVVYGGGGDMDWQLIEDGARVG